MLKMIPNHEIDIVFDYDLWPSRRPKVIMQTVGHVSGAAYFYSRQQLQKDPFPKEQVTIIGRRKHMTAYILMIRK